MILADFLSGLNMFSSSDLVDVSVTGLGVGKSQCCHSFLATPARNEYHLLFVVSLQESF